jgi:hypothetical protein
MITTPIIMQPSSPSWSSSFNEYPLPDDPQPRVRTHELEPIVSILPRVLMRLARHDR